MSSFIEDSIPIPSYDEFEHTQEVENKDNEVDNNIIFTADNEREIWNYSLEYIDELIAQTGYYEEADQDIATTYTDIENDDSITDITNADTTSLPDIEDENNMTWIFLALSLDEYLEQVMVPYKYLASYVIYESLFLCDGNMYQAADLIMLADNMIETCQPCRHMITSKCLRKDCYYQHDVSHIPCRYWMLSVGCNLYNQGQFCPFLHQLPPVSTLQYDSVNNNTNNSQITTSINVMDFPQLTSNKSKNNISKTNRDMNEENEIFTEAVSEADINKFKKQKQLQEVQKIYQTMFGSNMNISSLSSTSNNTINNKSQSYLSSVTTTTTKNNNRDNNNTNNNTNNKSNELEIVNITKRKEATVLLDTANTRWVETGNHHINNTTLK